MKGLCVAVKEQKVVLNGKQVMIKDLRKHGIEIIRPKPFAKARKLVQDKISAIKKSKDRTNDR